MSQKDYCFYYDLTGNPKQPALLFLHGFMGNRLEFEAAISHLSEFFYCVAVDLPAHGKTQVLGDESCYSVEKTAAGLIELLNSLTIQKCNLAGYSMGGRLALYLTLHYPCRFKKVVLESASPGLKTEKERQARQQRDEQLAQDLETVNFHTFLENWYNQPLFLSAKNHPNFNQLIADRLDNNPQELAKSLRWMGTGNQPSLWEKLTNHQIPLLLLAGEFDHKFIQINIEIAQICPMAQLQVVPQAGHNVHWEHLSAYLQAVHLFLRNSTSG